MEQLQMLVQRFQLAGHPSGIKQPELRGFEHDERGSGSGFPEIGFEQAGARHQLGHSDSVARFAGQQRDALRKRGAFEDAQGDRVDARRGAAISSTTPPPMVTTGENMRTMKRSPGSISSGSLRTRRTYSRDPGAMGSVPCSRRISASTSAVPA